MHMPMVQSDRLEYLGSELQKNGDFEKDVGL